jgi:hypothetical protein
MFGTLALLGHGKWVGVQPLIFGTLASKYIYKFFSMCKGATVPRASALLGQECNSATVPLIQGLAILGFTAPNQR